MSYFDHFSKSKSTKLGDFLNKKIIEKEFSFIENYLPSNKNIRILEIGPGKGLLAKCFIDRGYLNYNAIEPNSFSRKNLLKIGVKKIGDYLVPPIKEKGNSFDLVILDDVFEHLNDTKEAKLLIHDIKKILKKGGIVSLISPDLIDWKMDFWNCDFSHSNPTTVRRTTQLFNNENIEVLNYKYYYSIMGGVTGFLFNKLIKILIITKGDSSNSKLYKLKLNFLRRFNIIGIKK